MPYLAVLPNEGGWQDLYSIFLEPATASFDRLDVARVRGERSTVKAGTTYEWYLSISVGNFIKHAHSLPARSESSG